MIRQYDVTSMFSLSSTTSFQRGRNFDRNLTQIGIGESKGVSKGNDIREGSIFLDLHISMM
jgi:hypothetical protein